MLGDASNAIEVRNVWKVFGQGSPDEAIALAKAGSTRQDIITSIDQTVAVRDVSFSVARGETFVVMGLSGSGKSTLIRCLSRLVDPTAGEVLLNGEDLLAMDDEQLREVRRGKISMVFQHFGLFPHRRVIDNIAYGLEVQGVDKTTRLARANDVLEIVGLSGWADHYPQQLSGGMQQRASLCRALIHQPRLLMLDEPFGALDIFTREDLWAVLQKLWLARRPTVILVTHDLREAAYLADRVLVMSSRPGRIIAERRVDFPRARTMETTYTTEFQDLVHELRDRISDARDAEEIVDAP